MVRYTIRPGERDAVRAAAIEFVDAIKANEPDTLRYEALYQQDGVSFVHFMSFTDEAAEARHRGMPHVRKFVEFVYPKCVTDPVFTSLKLLRSTAR